MEIFLAFFRIPYEGVSVYIVKPLADQPSSEIVGRLLVNGPEYLPSLLDGRWHRAAADNLLKTTGKPLTDARSRLFH